MIQATALRKSFGALTAVDDLALDIPKGELFGLLGPNGAGKTTTISMLVGALRPDGGEVRINGDADPTRASVRRQIGLAPQALALYDELTAEENLAFYGRLYGLRGPALSKRVGWALDFAGLADRRRDRLATFSGGMKRRINLAAGLVHEPQVLFLDEPTVGVDPQSRNYIFESIEQLKAQGLTILYTTHYMEEAQRLCDRVAIMDHGRILALDTVDVLIRQYGGLSVVTAELDRPPQDPAALPGALDGTTLRIETTEPLAELARLAAAGVSFSTLKVERPDLEVVFLALTGRRLRD
jgi:ABC-2 type transport system ATP-binding protein